MHKKNGWVILVILLAILLIALVIWWYDKRMKNVEKKMPLVTGFTIPGKINSEIKQASILSFIL